MRAGRADDGAEGAEADSVGYDRPDHAAVFDLAMDYSDDDILLDWEQYAGVCTSFSNTCDGLRPASMSPSVLARLTHLAGYKLINNNCTTSTLLLLLMQAARSTHFWGRM